MAKHIEVIARGVCIRANHLLVCRNIAGAYCYLPGGHVEFGELSADSLRRELVEEAGESVTVGELLWIDECRFEQIGRGGAVKARHEVNLLYSLEILPRGKVLREIRSLESHIRFEWVAVAALGASNFKPASALKWLAKYCRAARK